MKFLFIKIIFFSIISTQYVGAKDNFMKNIYIDTLQKNEEIVRENFIATENIKELENKINDQNENIESLESEKNILEEKNERLENIKIIEINQSILITFFIIIILFILVIIFLAIIIRRQRKWRQKYFDENLGQQYIAQLPERIADTIENSDLRYEKLNENNSIQYDNFNKNLQQVVNLINQVNSVNTENVSKINDQLSELRKFSDEKNELVKKYQAFYDLGILKSFIFEIISAIDNLEDSLKQLKNQNQPQSSLDAVNLAKDQLIILLENENILQKEPNLELKYNDPKQPIKLKVMKNIEVEEESLVGNISEILHSGYAGQIGKNNEEKLIRESYVSIYINKKGVN